MYICYVKHEHSNKPYLFDCSNFSFLRRGNRVICDTIYGQQPGTLVCDPLEIKGPEDSVKFYLLKCGGGGYLPLKKVIRTAPDISMLSDAEKGQIAVEWLREKLTADDLPF